MRSKNLRLWLRAAKRGEHPDQGNWEKVITIIQADFRGGKLASPCAWKTLVMIPNGGGTNFRWIGLVEVLWKAISVIINCQILSSIQFHEALHSIHKGRGTGTATPEANMLQYLIAIMETVSHAIFLNLRKAYYALDRDHCLDILVGFVVGPRTLRILWKHWVQLQMAAKTGGALRSCRIEPRRGNPGGTPVTHDI